MHISSELLMCIVPASPSTLSDQEVDDFAVAQSTPLPECIAGFEGDTVCCPSFTADLHSALLCFLCVPPSEAIFSGSPRPPSYTGWRLLR